MSVKEFIVYGHADGEIKETAIRIFDQYKKDERRPYQSVTTNEPLIVHPQIRGEETRKAIDWPSVRQCQRDQEKERPRDQGGCQFRWLPDADIPSDPKEYLQTYEGLH